MLYYEFIIIKCVVHNKIDIKFQGDSTLFIKGFLILWTDFDHKIKHYLIQCTKIAQACKRLKKPAVNTRQKQI